MPKAPRVTPATLEAVSKSTPEAEDVGAREKSGDDVARRPKVNEDSYTAFSCRSTFLRNF